VCTLSGEPEVVVRFLALENIDIEGAGKGKRGGTTQKAR